jgi:membrane protease YdiL (CAAX protease family)
MLGILLLIARGLPRREAFGLRRPESWSRAVGLTVLCLFTIYVAQYAYDRILSAFGDWNPTEEQGLVPDGWDSSRAGAFVAFFIVVTFVGPAVEELTYRGLGFSLLMPYGYAVAILVTAILFGAVHGLLIILLPLVVFGLVIGWLRMRTDSIYPPMLLHSVYNGAALIVSVTLLG